MQSFDTQRTVRDIAVEVPGATRIFERIGIDYCCGGRKPLAEACQEKGLDLTEVLGSLEALEAEAEPGEDDPAGWTLERLSDHIVATHHVFTREELARLDQLVEKVCSVHGERHPELLELKKLFAQLAGDLTPHMLKEEQVLFPYVKDLERAATAGRARPTPFFGTVRNPVRMMMLEHDAAGEIFARMREVTRDYELPEGACITYETLYRTLADFEAFTHEHIHLENNILFPKAVAMESEA